MTMRYEVKIPMGGYHNFDIPLKTISPSQEMVFVKNAERQSRRSCLRKSYYASLTKPDSFLRCLLLYPSQPVPVVGAVFSFVGAACSDLYRGSLTTELTLGGQQKPLRVLSVFEHKVAEMQG